MLHWRKLQPTYRISREEHSNGFIVSCGNNRVPTDIPERQLYVI